ncbi:MAG: hypothetical protein VB138_05390 [Burkholderia sp.]
MVELRADLDYKRIRNPYLASFATGSRTPPTGRSSRLERSADMYRAIFQTHGITRDTHIAIDRAPHKVLYRSRNANRKQDFS